MLILLIRRIKMDVSKFNGKAGDIIARSGTFKDEFVEFYYFLPKPLPTIEEIFNDVTLFKKANEANLALGELKGLAKSNIGTLELFTESSMRKEAVDSSKIEGTFVSLTDVFLSEEGDKKPENANPNVKEVMNFVRCIEFALNELKNNRKIDSEFLNEMHKILLQEVRGHNKKVGDFRSQPNWIGNKGAVNDILEADFVPPSEEKVKELMDYLFEYMEKEDGSLRLLKIGLMHYYFETIHPYEDGNGRLGRTLILLYLIKLGILDSPLLYLSPYFNKYKEAYYGYLMQTRQTGDYVSWLKFFLDGIKETALDTCRRLRKLIDLLTDYRKKLTDAKATTLSFEILNKFFERPYSTISRLEYKLKQNYPRIKRAIIKLEQCGIIKEFTKGKRNKFYIAPEILNVIEENNI